MRGVRRQCGQGHRCSRRDQTEALLAVGFPENMRNLPASELPIGRRAQLTWLGAALKRADRVLLDESTNHLGVKSANRLGDYAQSITKCRLKSYPASPSARTGFGRT